MGINGKIFYPVKMNLNLKDLKKAIYIKNHRGNRYVF